MCADSSLFLPPAVHGAAWLESSPGHGSTSATKAVSGLWEEGVVLRVACPAALDGSARSTLRCVSHASCLPGPTRGSCPGAVLPGSLCLSAAAPGHVLVGKWVSESPDAGGEPVDCSKQCRHSVTAWVWLCVFGREWQYILMGFSTFLQCSFESVLFPRGKSTGDNTELTTCRM